MIKTDLAFGFAGVDLLEEDNDRLLSDTAWALVFNHWIELVRTDPKLRCPFVVRQATEVSLGLSFTDDAGIADLNNQWRQKPNPTDVLSFAALEGTSKWMDGAAVELGDIIVSLDMARRQAQEYRHSLERELQWLVSHGLLHLLGWDHYNDVSLSSMLALQERLLEITSKIFTKDR
ncbi:rRNA maturation RNase YbeY [Synechococcus sp. M16CYN]|uniref:rRNA maturation RNase YbeY n=1 Tax=Synechococcus sp. M16CYN TaxID=3103139 RepID=UPI00324311D3